MGERDRVGVVGRHVRGGHHGPSNVNGAQRATKTEVPAWDHSTATQAGEADPGVAEWRSAEKGQPWKLDRDLLLLVLWRRIQYTGF